MTNFEKIQNYLTEMGYAYEVVDPKEEILAISDRANGISRLLMDCDDPILVLEQFICELNNPSDSSHLSQLLKLNRTLVHGAFSLDDSGQKVIYRDTLQLANLDLNELRGSIEALGLAMAENAKEFIEMSKKAS